MHLGYCSLQGETGRAVIRELLPGCRKAEEQTLAGGAGIQDSSVPCSSPKELNAGKLQGEALG